MKNIKFLILFNKNSLDILKNDVHSSYNLNNECERYTSMAINNDWNKVVILLQQKNFPV